MLLGLLPTEVPKENGRLVSFSCGDIDIRLTTGLMRERVLGFLYLNGIPSVAREVAMGIQSNASRVTKTLKELVEQGTVDAIKHEGCVMEYSLTPNGVKSLKSSPVFAELLPPPR